MVRGGSLIQTFTLNLVASLLLSFSMGLPPTSVTWPRKVWLG